jgi:hypothetical protein
MCYGNGVADIINSQKGLVRAYSCFFKPEAYVQYLRQGVDPHVLFYGYFVVSLSVELERVAQVYGHPLLKKLAHAAAKPFTGRFRQNNIYTGLLNNAVAGPLNVHP